MTPHTLSYNFVKAIRCTFSQSLDSHILQKQPTISTPLIKSKQSAKKPPLPNYGIIHNEIDVNPSNVRPNRFQAKACQFMIRLLGRALKLLIN